jgi:hypothetical protein
MVASPSLDEAEAQTIQAGYEEAKRQALDPLLLHLNDLPRAHHLRDRFDEWVDAIR